MARSFDGVNQDLSGTYPNIVGAKTVAMWVYPRNITSPNYVWSINNASGQGNVKFRNNANGDIQVAIRFTSQSAVNRSVSGTVAANTWQHICFTHTGSVTGTTILIYIDGSEVSYAADQDGIGTEETNDTVYVASLVGGTYSNAIICELAYWDIVLPTGDISSLAAKYSPVFISPQNLKAYNQLIGRTSPEIGIVGGYDLTLANGPTAAAHPPIIYPSSYQQGLTIPSADVFQPRPGASIQGGVWMV